MILGELHSNSNILINVILIKSYVINGVLLLINWKSV